LNNSGINFIRLIDIAQQDTRNKSEALNEFKSERERVGIYLKALYDISTCAFGCHKGDHTMEYLSGRAFNLAYSAYDLCRAGFYDEAFNQIRSLGELTNILALRIYDNTSFEVWLRATDKERLDRFKPVQIRILIERANGIIVVDKDVYAELCKLATHITPKTVPNLHSDDQRPRVGGGFQEKGFNKALEKISELLFFSATTFAKFTGHDELFEQIVTTQDNKGET
jgi:hypothetical protein